MKKLEYSHVLPRFQALAVLSLRNRKLDNNIQKYFSADFSKLEIRDSDKANQVDITSHHCSAFSNIM